MVGRFLRWLLDVPPTGDDAVAALYAETLGELAQRVTLEIDTIYANGATGAIILRATLAELAHRATTTDEAERALWPASVDLPALPAGCRYRFRFCEYDGPPIYAGSSVTVERPSEPVPNLRPVN